MDHPFLNELKRRRVYRVGVGYAAFAFVVLQGADLVFPALGLSDTAFQLLVILMMAGFPVALVLAWLFDLTPKGLVRTQGEEAPTLPEGRHSWVMLWAAALVVSIVAMGATGWWFLHAVEDVEAEARPSQRVLDAKSLAVMPFVNLSGDANEEYFSDGITDAVITALTRVRGIKVASRTSSFAFKSSARPVQEIGQELGVASVLEGSVRKDGETVRVDVHLADTQDGFEIWTERYARPLTDVFDVQEEIAQAIVRVLEVTIAERPDEPLVHGTTANAMAYDKYLWGEYNRNKRSPSGYDDAIANYEDAIGLDSTFALAWAGLARTLIGRSAFPGAARDEVLARADTSAERALALDANLAAAHAAHGAVLFEYFNRWDEAESELRRAIEIEPQAAEHRQELAVILAVRGRMEEARALAMEAVRLNPLSPGAHADRAAVLQAAGDVAGAEAAYRQALDIDESFGSGRFGLEFLLVAEGRIREARELSADRPDADRPGPRTGVPVGGAPAGPPRDAQTDEAFLDVIEARALGEDEVSATIRAPLLAAIGRVDDAVAALRAAHDARDLSPLAILRAMAVPAFRADPDVKTFLQEIGLAEA
ncbi:MAG: hypothetical protein R3E10_10485 [Gemmatimonadota bacterium]